MLLICKNPGGLSKLRIGRGLRPNPKKRVRIVRSSINLIVIASFTCSPTSCQYQTSTLSKTKMATRLSTSLPMARTETLYSSRAVKLKQTSNKSTVRCLSNTMFRILLQTHALSKSQLSTCASNTYLLSIPTTHSISMQIVKSLTLK